MKIIYKGCVTSKRAVCGHPVKLVINTAIFLSFEKKNCTAKLGRSTTQDNKNKEGSGWGSSDDK